MFRKKFLPFFILFSCSFFSSFAQTSGNRLGAWYMYFGTNRLSDKISLHTEAQFRSYTIAPNLEQLLLRTGINYHYSADLWLTAGYGHITNYVDEDKFAGLQTQAEHRIWQQLLTTQTFGRLKFEHRYRVEQRFISFTNPLQENIFRNRLRYRLFAAVALNKPNLGPGTAYLAAYNEVFLHLHQNVFDRNRLYFAAGYQFTKVTNMQFGWMRQSVSQPLGAPKSLNYLQFALLFNPDFRPANP